MYTSCGETVTVMYPSSKYVYVYMCVSMYVYVKYVSISVMEIIKKIFKKRKKELHHIWGTGGPWMPFRFPYFNLGVTSRDLAMTETVFLKIGISGRYRGNCWGWNGIIWGNRN